MQPHDNGAQHPRTAAELTIAHTSDLHLGGRYHAGGELSALRAVLDAADEAGAQVLILAGDIFDSNRIAAATVDRAANMLADARMPVAILPGNHDPATPDAIFRRTGITSIAGVYVFGVSGDGSAVYPELDLDIWGSPHIGYDDMAPLASVPARSQRWHVVVAHGHWVRGAHDAHRSWLIHDHELSATGADYVALGHWDVPQPAGDGSVPAFYSGSPEIAKTLNVVRFTASGADVRRHALRFDEP